MTNTVKIVECPRDAWQGLPVQIPSDVKAGYLRELIDAGFTHIDAVSFVSSAAVPQMADSERVLELLNPPKTVEIIGIVVNERGAERAIRTGAVRTLGFPYSISPEFLRRNQHQTPQESLRIFRAVAISARHASLNVVAYISMAFGNPYGDSWSAAAIIDACKQLIEAGANEISLADTVGLATRNRSQRRLEQQLTLISKQRSESICTHGAEKQPRAFTPLMTRAAGASMQPLAASAVARLHRTIWWATFPRRF